MNESGQRRFCRVFFDEPLPIFFAPNATPLNDAMLGLAFASLWLSLLGLLSDGAVLVFCAEDCEFFSSIGISTASAWMD